MSIDFPVYVYECPNGHIVSAQGGLCMECDAQMVKAEYVNKSALAAAEHAVYTRALAAVAGAPHKEGAVHAVRRLMDGDEPKQPGMTLQEVKDKYFPDVTLDQLEGRADWPKIPDPIADKAQPGGEAVHAGA